MEFCGPRSNATSICSGAPSNEPCAVSVPLGRDGRSRTLTSAERIPLCEPRTATAELIDASALSAVVGPPGEPDALNVPARIGDKALRSDTSRFQRAVMLPLPTVPLADREAALPVIFAL